MALFKGDTKDDALVSCHLLFGGMIERHVYITHGVLFVVPDDCIATLALKVAKQLKLQMRYSVSIAICFGDGKTQRELMLDCEHGRVFLV